VPLHIVADAVYNVNRFCSMLSVFRCLGAVAYCFGYAQTLLVQFLMA